MRETKYTRACEWIALNDESGDDLALDESRVEEYVTVGLVADIFGRATSEVAKKVVKIRRKEVAHAREPSN